MSTRVSGHAHTVRGVNIRQCGMYATASGYNAICACGWSTGEVGDRTDATTLHEAHKADVANGGYATKVAAETARRLDTYDALLADPAALARTSLTAEQVQRWRAELTSGATTIDVRD